MSDKANGVDGAVATPRPVSRRDCSDPMKGLGVRDIPIYSYPMYDIPRGRRLAVDSVPINRIVAPTTIRTQLGRIDR